MSGVELRAGKKMRVRVEHPELGCGFSWTIDTSREGDVYLFCREAGDWVHTSLHASGQWHYMVTAEGQRVEPDAGRYLDVGKERRPVGPGVWLAARVVVPVSELRPPVVVDGKRVVSVAPMEGFNAVYLEIYRTDPGAAALQFDRAREVARFVWDDGRRAFVVARPAMVGDIHVALSDVIGRAKEQLVAKFGWDGSPTRIAVVVAEDDEFGFKQQVEVALDSTE